MESSSQREIEKSNNSITEIRKTRDGKKKQGEKKEHANT
jgi:hypothetical protein